MAKKRGRKPKVAVVDEEAVVAVVDEEAVVAVVDEEAVVDDDDEEVDRAVAVVVGAHTRFLRVSLVERKRAIDPRCRYPGDKPHTNCLTEGCVNPSETRGLCHSCYIRVRLAVRAGRGTWADYIAAGKILESRRR